MTGIVVGVGFDPGKNEIRIKHPEGKTTFAFTATQDQVNAAIQHRGQLVRVQVVVGATHNRVLRIAAVDAPRYEPTTEDRERLIFDKWRGVLSVLAQ